ncbi:uncharacterized protein MONBRDRAFT_13728 [Monosiga brevicollis MX1]|uniref:3-oxo-5-alpha-steroid 4-dehydrogenase 1 n=1 Tax=Monosiga brevicollis TaxID=81824 RepID=A9UPT2_MONBE|nr:uncharacterized protein MONBRDRAFT_13728 [Monosiga brevicollis MX1]EDQ92926.1 predicted protein [Monosiga brevicollis MX1]|eukprot:XP_001742688.1 hypothetical protein [Monosiga brevicollis MX1]
MPERDLVEWLALAVAVTGVPTVIALLSGARAAYGRYVDDNKGLYGFNMNGKLAWIIQESPCLFMGFLNLWNCHANVITNKPNALLFAFFIFHYVHRTLVFPLFLKGKDTPVLIMLMAFFFCTINGYIQTAWLTRVQAYDDAYATSPRFIIGMVLAGLGLFVNLHSDYTLIYLRKPGEKDYKIPRGGMFEFVSGANFFGEMLEWAGFAIAGNALVPLSFALFTACNIGPRALQHHQWYLEKFKEEYPKQRKALIPFLL